MENNLTSNNRKKNKKNFCEIKNNTISSLYEVEHFLQTFKKTCTCINLYKLLKK